MEITASIGDISVSHNTNRIPSNLTMDIIFRYRNKMVLPKKSAYEMLFGATSAPM